MLEPGCGPGLRACRQTNMTNIQQESTAVSSEQTFKARVANYLSTHTAFTELLDLAIAARFTIATPLSISYVGAQTSRSIA